MLEIRPQVLQVLQVELGMRLQVLLVLHVEMRTMVIMMTGAIGKVMIMFLKGRP